MKNTLLKIVIACTLFSVCLLEAQAEILGQAMSSSGTPFKVNGQQTDWTPVIISGGPSTGGGGPLINFKTTQNGQLISISFTAVCEISSPVNTFLYVRFMIDGVLRAPKYNELCAGRGTTTTGIGNDVGTATAAMWIQNAGTHDFRVFARVATPSLTTVDNGIANIRGNTTIIQN